MICRPCARAADARAPRDAHCHDPACTCGHRVDRYRPALPPMIRLLADGAPFTIPASSLASYEAASQEARALADRFAEALPGRMTEIADQLTAQLPPEARAAGIHLAYDTTPEA